MDLSQLPDEVGCWKRERVLGAGGFGYVVLWRNKESSETIALKQCRWGHDTMMTPKHRSRWKLEVDMMSRLNHANVVKAISVPPELDVPATELPLLAMEYCAGGDLRRMLNKPENCCGLNEKIVRILLKHVSSAVNYLHSMRIIHRDLKPENIVIQDMNGSVVFKLIDLGYAKELDQGSLCTSFVGTFQYLAPELFLSQKYSCTVDYWSLGLVTHEVITGLRPFLPDKSPAEWIPIIKQKSSEQIRVCLDPDKNIVFSQEIAPYHHICSILKKDIESWLQIMLEYDPKKRGRCEGSSAFNVLDKILDKKVMYVFCVSNCTLFSFSVDELESVDDLKKQLMLKSGIPINDQEIFLPKGNVPNPEKGISQFVYQAEDEELNAYLFNKNESHNMSPLPDISIPPAVEAMMRNPRTEVKYEVQRISWSQAVFLSQQQYFIVSKLIQAFRCNLVHLINKTSQSHKSASKMASEMNKVCAKSLFLRCSLEQDISCYEKQAENGGFTSQNLFDGWKNSYENLKKMDLLKQKVSSLEEKSSSIDIRTIDLQKMNFARSKQTNPLEEVHNKTLEAFSELKRRSRDKRAVLHDNTDIVRLLCSCLQQRQKIQRDIMILIRTTNEIKQEIDEVMPQILNILQEINEWDAQICNWQYRRQMDMWKVIDALNLGYMEIYMQLSMERMFILLLQNLAFMRDKIHCLERSSSPLPLSSSPQAPFTRYASLIRPVFTRQHGDSISNIKRASQDLTIPTTLLRSMSPPIMSTQLLKNKIEPLSSGSAYLNDDMEKMKPSASLQSIGGSSLSLFLDRTVEDASRVKKENETLVESFQQMFNTLKHDQATEKFPDINGHKIHDFKEDNGDT